VGFICARAIFMCAYRIRAAVGHCNEIAQAWGN
jgi:hypothetical protein